MKAPFNKSPLQQFPYNSRTHKNEFSSIFDAKNYILHGFKPGNSLQASELNEVQENFYKSLTLHNHLLKNWFLLPFTAESSGDNTPITGPSWKGAVPLDPFNSVIVTDTTVTFKKDWYLVDDFSGIKFWIYNNSQKTITYSSGQFVGLTIANYYITSEQDSDLYDNSGAYYNSSLSPGADRYQLQIMGAYVSSVATTNLEHTGNRDIFKSVLISGIHKLRYLNNLLPTITT